MQRGVHPLPRQCNSVIDSANVVILDCSKITEEPQLLVNRRMRYPQERWSGGCGQPTLFTRDHESSLVNSDTVADL